MALYWNKQSTYIFFILSFIGMFGSSCKKEKDLTKTPSFFQIINSREPYSVAYNPFDDKFYCLIYTSLYGKDFFQKLQLMDNNFKLGSEASILFDIDSNGNFERLFYSKGCILPGKGFIASGGTFYPPAFQTISFIDDQFKTHRVDSFNNYTLNDIKATSDGGFVVLAGSQVRNNMLRGQSKLFKYNNKLKLEYKIDLNYQATYGHEFFPLGISETEKGTFAIGGSCIEKQILPTKAQISTNFFYEIDASGNMVIEPMLFKINKIFSYFDPLQKFKIFILPGNKYCTASSVYNEVNSSFDICVRIIDGNGKTFKEAYYGGDEDEILSDAILSNGHLVSVSQYEKARFEYLTSEMHIAKIDLEDLSLKFNKSFQNYSNDFKGINPISLCERNGIYYCFGSSGFATLMCWKVDSESGEWKQ